MLTGALITQDNPLKDIKKSLENIDTNFNSLTKGFKKIKTICYTVEEDKKEKEETIKQAQKMIDKAKKQKEKQKSNDKKKKN